MPGCCVPECRNRSEGGYRLFRVPSAQNDNLRRKVWLDYINRRELPTRALICEIDDELRNLEGETSQSAEVISSKQGNLSGIMSTVYVVGIIH
ncbi:hypothetical protein FQA39_LY06690 [Lamprigera yunnana]|nr:hypothetical protein FQA39_LY06690 [Lamprigera yunnana]